MSDTENREPGEPASLASWASKTFLSDESSNGHPRKQITTMRSSGMLQIFFRLHLQQHLRSRFGLLKDVIESKKKRKNGDHANGSTTMNYLTDT